MTSEIETQTFDWFILDYNERCTQVLNRDETVVFVSPRNKNMAKIEVKTITDREGRRNTMVSISIKTEQCANLIMVICDRTIIQLIDGTNETISSEVVAAQEFSGESREWRPLVVRNQFDLTNFVVLKFEFIFKKNDEMNRYLQTDLRNHLMNPAFSDVTIKTSEGNEIPAHKILLVARSDVFRAQIEHDNTVECPFEINVVIDLLSYIYQDVAPNIDDTAFKLLEAADYYHLDHLKELCEDVLAKQLTNDNAVELLTLAYTHRASRLRQSALEFVKDKKNAVL